MNEKVETVEAVSDSKKITAEELTDLQKHVNQINNAQLQLGQLVSQKHSILKVIPELQKGLKTFQEGLEKEYGNVSINIQDGTIEEAPATTV
tara:strand:- start:816 stop:1091 length:276 start_codon:yes stop_codon:yes gene_type:complete